MPQFTKLTPNLIVASVERSLQFYEEVLGFKRGFLVPEQGPFAFASATNGPVEIFLNDRAAVVKDHPQHASRFEPTMMASGIDAWSEQLGSGRPW